MKNDSIIPARLADWDLVQHDSATGFMLWRFEARGGLFSFELSLDPRLEDSWQLWDSEGYSYAQEGFATVQGALDWLQENI